MPSITLMVLQSQVVYIGYKKYSYGIAVISSTFQMLPSQVGQWGCKKVRVLHAAVPSNRVRVLQDQVVH